MKTFKKGLIIAITNMLALIICFSATFIKPNKPVIDMEPVYEIMFPFIPDAKNGDILKLVKEGYKTVKNLDKEDFYLYYNQAKVFVKYLEISEYQKVFEIRDHVVSETIRIYGANDRAEDSDAFRHLYITALLALEINEEFSVELMKVHEINNLGSMDAIMDSHNNEVALKLYHKWLEEYKPSDKSKYRESLSDFMAHCVQYGDIYNILKFDDAENPTKLIYTSKEVSSTYSYSLPYEKLHLTHKADHFSGDMNQKEIVHLVEELGHSFETTKTNCSCHDKKYFILSPGASNGTAYHIYKFNETVGEVEIKLSIVSKLTKKDFAGLVATIDYLDENNEWVTCVNLLDVLKTNTNYDNLEAVRVAFPKHTYGFRIYISTNNLNFGDVCICEGDVDIFFDKNK